MPRIEQADLIQEMTPEQRILISQFYTNFDNRSAANRRIINVEPIFYQGVSAGTEFLTYAATKLYIYLSMSLGSANAVARPNIVLYNEANAVFGGVSASCGIWNGTTLATEYIPITLESQNGYFSRIVVTGLVAFKFIGYRFTLV
jgi:hypothetical protein